MAGLILIVQILSLLLSKPMERMKCRLLKDPRGFQLNIYFVMILTFTLFVLIAIKKNMKWVISLLIYLRYIKHSILCIFRTFNPDSFTRRP